MRILSKAAPLLAVYSAWLQGAVTELLDAVFDRCVARRGATGAVVPLVQFSIQLNVGEVYI